MPLPRAQLQRCRHLAAHLVGVTRCLCHPAGRNTGFVLKKATSAICRAGFYGNGTSEEQKCGVCSKITASSREHVAFARPFPLRRWPGTATSPRQGGVEVGQEVGCCGLDLCQCSACPHLNPLAEQLWSRLAASATTLSSTAWYCGRGWWGPGGEDQSCIHSCRLWVGRSISFLTDLPEDGQGVSTLMCSGDPSSCRGSESRERNWVALPEAGGGRLSLLPDLWPCLLVGNSVLSCSA